MAASDRSSLVPNRWGASGSQLSPRTGLDSTPRDVNPKSSDMGDEKQSELFHLQFNLIREQMGNLARELATVRTDVSDLRTKQPDSTRQIQDLKSELERESTMRQREDDEAMKRFDQLRHAFEKDSREKSSKEDELARKERATEDAVEQERHDRTQALQNIEANLLKQVKDMKIQSENDKGERSSKHSHLEKWCADLRMAISDEATQRNAAFEEAERDVRNSRHTMEQEWQEMQTQLRKIRLSLDEEALKRSAADEKNREDMIRLDASEDHNTRQLSLLSGSVDREAGDRASAIETMSNRIREMTESDARMRQTATEDRVGQLQHQMRSDMDAEVRDRREALSEVQKALQGLDKQIADQSREHKIVIEMEQKERGAKFLQFEQKHSELHEKFASERTARERAHETMREQLQREGSARDQHHSTVSASMLAMEQKLNDEFKAGHRELKDQLGAHKSGLDKHRSEIQTLFGAEKTERADSHRLLDQKMRDELGRVAAEHSKVHGELRDNIAKGSAAERQAREQHRGDIQTQMANDRTSRDEHHGALLSSVDALDKQHKEEMNRMAKKHESTHGALQDALAGHKNELRDELGRLSSSHDSRHNDMRASMDAEMTRLSNDHSSNHQALRDMFAGHASDHKEALAEQDTKLREQIAKLDSDHSSNHSAMREQLMAKLADVDGQIADHKNGVDEMLQNHAGAHGSALEQMEADVRAQMEALANDHTKGHEATRDAMLKQLSDLDGQLRGEIDQHKGDVNDSLQLHESTREAHSSALAEMDAQFRTVVSDHSQGSDSLRVELDQHRKWMDEMLQGHADNHSSALEDMDAQVQEQIRQLASDHSESHSGTREYMLAQLQELEENLKGEITNESSKNKDMFDSHSDNNGSALVEMESKVRAQMEALANDHTESHKAANAQLIAQLQEQDNKLRGEIDSHKMNIDEMFQSHTDTHGSALIDMEANVKFQMEALAADHTKGGEAQREAMMAKLQDLDTQLTSQMGEESEKYAASLDDHKAAFDAAHGDHKNGLLGSLSDMEEKLKNLETSHSNNHNELRSLFDEHKDATDAAHADHGDARANIITNLQEIEAQVKAQMEALAADHSSAHQETRDLMVQQLADFDRELRGEIASESAKHEAGRDDLLSAHDGHREALMSHLQELEGKMKTEMSTLSDGHSEAHDSLREMLDGHRSDFEQAHDDHRGGFLSALEDMEMKLKDQIKSVEDKHDDNHSALRGILDDHDGHRTNMVGTLQDMESQVRAQMEALANDHSSAHQETRDLMIQQLADFDKELRGEIASESAKHEAGRDDLLSAHDGHREALMSHLGDLESKLRVEMGSMSDEHNSKLGGLLESHDEHKSGILASLANMEAALDATNELHDDHKDQRSNMVATLNAMDEQLRLKMEELSNDHSEAHKEANAKMMEQLSQFDRDVRQEIVAENSKTSDAHDGHREALFAKLQALEGNVGAIKESHEETHNALAGRLDGHRAELEAAHSDHKEGFLSALESLESKLQGVEDKHDANHASMSGMLEEHGQTKEGMLASLNDMDAQVKKQIEELAADHSSNHDSMLAKLRGLDSELRTEITTVQDDHSSLKGELLAGHDNHRSDLLAHIREIEDGLKSEMSSGHEGLQGLLADHRDNAVSRGGNIEDMVAEMQRQMDQMGRDHSENHAGLQARLDGGVGKSSLEEMDEVVRQKMEALRNDHSAAHAEANAKMMEQLKFQDERLRADMASHKGGHSETLQEMDAKVQQQIRDLMNDHSAAHSEGREKMLANLQQMDVSLRNQMSKHADNHNELKDAHLDHKQELAQLLAGHGDAHQQNLADMDANVQQQLADLRNDHSQTNSESRDKMIARLSQMDKQLREQMGQHADNHEQLKNDLMSHAGNATDSLEGMDSRVRDQIAALTQENQKGHSAARDHMLGQLRDMDAALRSNMQEESAKHNANHNSVKDMFNQHKVGFEAKMEQEKAARDEHRGNTNTALKDVEKKVDAVSEKHNVGHAGLRDMLQEHKFSMDSHVTNEKLKGEKNKNEMRDSVEGLAERLREEMSSMSDGHHEHANTLRDLIAEHKLNIGSQLQNEERARETHHIQHRTDVERVEKTIRKEMGQSTNQHQGAVGRLQDVIDEFKNGNQRQYAQTQNLIVEVKAKAESSSSELKERLRDIEQALMNDDIGSRKGGQVPRLEFEKETKRLWEAMDTHTHDMSQSMRLVSDSKVVQMPITPPSIPRQSGSMRVTAATQIPTVTLMAAPPSASPRVSSAGTAVIRRTSPTFPLAALEPVQMTQASPPMSGRSYSDRNLLAPGTSVGQYPAMVAGGSVSVMSAPPMSPALAVTGGGDLEDISCGPARHSVYGYVGQA